MKIKNKNNHIRYAFASKEKLNTSSRNPTPFFGFAMADYLSNSDLNPLIAIVAAWVIAS